MREMEQQARVKNDAVTGSPFHITGIRVRFEDVEQERRFIRQQLAPQRAVTVGACLVLLVAIGVQRLIARRLDDAPIAAPNAVVLLVAGIALIISILGLLFHRSPSWTFRWIVIAAVVLAFAAGALIAAGTMIAAQSILVVPGGVVVAYFTSRLDFLGSLVAAVLYSAVTVPAWLIFGPEVDRPDMVYTLVATALAHLVGIAETRRMQRTLRKAFAQHEDLRQLSTIDVLTGLANRRAFDERLDAVWQSWQVTGRTPSVLMLDLDHFKKLNDSLGHAAGDVALRMVADAIRGALRKDSDHMVARYGGEEFVVLLPHEEHQVVHAVAERVIAAVRGSGVDRAVVPRGVERPAGLPPLTISVGIARGRASMQRAAELVDAADRALYRAKGDGRNCVRCDDDAEPSASMRPF